MRRPTLLIHIGLMILASVIIVLLALLWMNLFTRHGSSVEIPDIYGLPESEAEELLDKAHLRYEIIDSVYTTEVPKGAVYDLTPKAGSRVKAYHLYHAQCLLPAQRYHTLTHRCLRATGTSTTRQPGLRKHHPQLRRGIL